MTTPSPKYTIGWWVGLLLFLLSAASSVVACLLVGHALHFGPLGCWFCAVALLQLFAAIVVVSQNF